jgi:hypothetical protein
MKNIKVSTKEMMYRTKGTGYSSIPVKIIMNKGRIIDNGKI